MERKRIMQTATVITHGSCQSVQLPEGFHIDGNEVYVKHLGKSVLLIPKDADPWDLMADSLGQFTDDFMLERSQPLQQHREGPFA
jgi:antitoxin VapB